jgi:hypothetical protein
LINPSLHRQPVALDPAKHRQLKLSYPVTDWSVAAKLNAIFVAGTEFTDVSREYAIVFVRAGRDASGTDMVAPIAVLGVAGEHNLYLDPQGGGTRWRAGYMPVVLQSYPFCIGRLDEQRFAVCLDMACTAVNETQGRPLFEADGQASELLKAMQEHLSRLEGEIQATRNFGQRLVELDLLRDMRFDATLPDGNKHTVEGFLTVDETKAQNLPDNVVGELHRSGMLALIQLHWASLGLMRKLMDWHVQHVGAAPGAAGVAANAPDGVPPAATGGRPAAAPSA